MSCCAEPFRTFVTAQGGHIAGGAYEVQEQFTKKAGVDQVPFSLREPGGRTLRQRSKPYSVSTGKIDTSDD